MGVSYWPMLAGPKRLILVQLQGVYSTCLDASFCFVIERTETGPQAVFCCRLIGTAPQFGPASQL